MNTIWTGLGTTESKFTETSEMFTYGVTSIMFVAIAAFSINDIIGPEWLIYIAGLMYLFSSLCIAAYLAVKVVDATVNFTEGMAHQYRDWSWVGNGLGLWEAFWAIYFLWWSGGITYEAFDYATQMVNTLGEREVAALTEGSLGHPVSIIEAMQHSTLLIVLAVVTWIVGCSLADSMDELINFYNKYDDKTDERKIDNDSNVYDEYGVATWRDLIYHTVTIIGADVVFGTMMVGAHWFYAYSGFADFKPAANCDLDDIDASRYSGLVSQIEGLTQGTYQECLDVIANVAKQVDVNGNNYIERCEDAKFLKAIGNTDEYSLNYSSERVLPYGQQICKYVVIDAFDQMPKADDGLMRTIFQLTEGFLPSALLSHDGSSEGFLGMRPMSLK